MSCQKKIQIEDIIYTANTDFRIAIECNRIAQDETIGDFERVLGIICTMFGNEALDKCKDHPTHYEKLFDWILKYLSCGKELNEINEETPDMDYIEDYDYIVASFQSDYSINLDKEEDMDWHRFFSLMNGLSNSDIGNCCVLNRIRNLRNINPAEIEDDEQRLKIIKAQKQVALKRKEKEEKVELTEEQQKSVDEFYKSLGY